MAYYLDDYKRFVSTKVQADETEFDDADAEDTVLDAIVRYSQIRPRQLVYEYTGDGSTYDLALPTGWVQDFSQIKKVEFPARKRNPQFMDFSDYEVIHKVAGYYLRLLNSTPSASEYTMVSYTSPHTVSDSSTTVPSSDFYAICYMAAAIACVNLAAKFAATIDPEINADSVNSIDKSRIWLELSDRYTIEANKRLGIKSGDFVPAATGHADYDWQYAWNRSFLTHPTAGR
jgi:hypothetical protein